MDWRNVFRALVTPWKKHKKFKGCKEKAVFNIYYGAGLELEEALKELQEISRKGGIEEKQLL
jgi:hypothetical protein